MYQSRKLSLCIVFASLGSCSKGLLLVLRYLKRALCGIDVHNTAFFKVPLIDMLCSQDTVLDMRR